MGGGKNWNISKRVVPHPRTPRNISDENFWFIYNTIRQRNILALSVVHPRASVDVVRYVQSV